MSIEPWSLLSRLVVLFRPRLTLSNDGTRCAEQATVVWGDRPCPGMFLRLYVYNFGWQAAPNCSVFVSEVRFGTNVLSADRSELSWTDEAESSKFDPKTIYRGRRRARLVDLCKVDAIQPQLQLLTKRSARGYDRYASEGVYTITVTAEAENLASNEQAVVEIRYRLDGGIGFEGMKTRRLRVW